MYSSKEFSQAKECLKSALLLSNNSIKVKGMYSAGNYSKCMQVSSVVPHPMNITVEIGLVNFFIETIATSDNLLKYEWFSDADNAYHYCESWQELWQEINQEHESIKYCHDVQAEGYCQEYIYFESLVDDGEF